MIVTVLAILFLLLLLATAVVGTRLIQKKSASASAGTERCTLCGNVFPKKELVLRQVGDARLFHFCRACIVRLAAEAGVSN